MLDRLLYVNKRLMKINRTLVKGCEKLNKGIAWGFKQYSLKGDSGKYSENVCINLLGMVGQIIIY